MSNDTKTTLNEPGYIKRRFVAYIDFIIGILLFACLLIAVPLFFVFTAVFPDISPPFVLIPGILLGLIGYYSIIPCYVLDGQTVFMKIMNLRVVSVNEDGEIRSIKENMSFLKSLGFLLYVIYIASRSLAHEDPKATGWKLINLE